MALLAVRYTVRLLGEEFFGRDVAIPPTNVTFRIQTGGAEAAEGTEHTYVLPSMPMRILSLLPAQAADIRDPSVDTFGDIEARRFRSTAELVAAAILFGFAAVLLVIAAVRAMERFRRRGPVASSRTCRSGPCSAAVVHEVERVRAEAARDGWTPGLAARALRRFASPRAVALSQPVTQKLVAGDAPAREGQLALRHGTAAPARALVSAPITADAIDRLRSAGNGHRDAGRQPGRPRSDPRGAGRSQRRPVRPERPPRCAGAGRRLDNGSSALRRLRAARLLAGACRGSTARSRPPSSASVHGATDRSPDRHPPNARRVAAGAWSDLHFTSRRHDAPGARSCCWRLRR